MLQTNNSVEHTNMQSHTSSFYFFSRWETLNLLITFLDTSAGNMSSTAETSNATSLNCAPAHWHRAITGNSNRSEGSTPLCIRSSLISKMAWSWNFYPPPSSDTHHSTTRLDSFHTPPGGLHLRLSPFKPGGTPMITVRWTRSEGFWGLELIWRATRQTFLEYEYEFEHAWDVKMEREKR